MCVFTAIGLWCYRWTQWPARTLREFDALVEQKRYEEATSRIKSEGEHPFVPSGQVHGVHVTQSIYMYYCDPQPRSFEDILFGRQVYKVNNNATCWVDTGKIQMHFCVDSLVLERGEIRFKWKGPMAHDTVRFENGEWIRQQFYYASPRLGGSPGFPAEIIVNSDSE
jgi:hypothetical protein